MKKTGTNPSLSVKGEGITGGKKGGRKRGKDAYDCGL